MINSFCIPDIAAIPEGGCAIPAEWNIAHCRRSRRLHLCVYPDLSLLDTLCLWTLDSQCTVCILEPRAPSIIQQWVVWRLGMPTCQEAEDTTTEAAEASIDSGLSPRLISVWSFAWTLFSSWWNNQSFNHIFLQRWTGQACWKQEWLVEEECQV